MIAYRALVVIRFAADEFLQLCVPNSSIVVTKSGEKCAAIIETQITSIISRFIEIDAKKTENCK